MRRSTVPRLLPRTERIAAADDSHCETVTTDAESRPRPGALPQRAGSMTLAGLVAHRASLTPDALLVVDDRDRCLTASEFQQEAARVAARLTELAVLPGQLVSWIMPTGIDALLVMVGLSVVGAVQNPIIPMYGPREVGHIFREAGVDVVVSVKSHRSTDYERMINELGAAGSQRLGWSLSSRCWADSEHRRRRAREERAPTSLPRAPGGSSTPRDRRDCRRGCSIPTPPSSPLRLRWPIASR